LIGLADLGFVFDLSTRFAFGSILPLTSGAHVHVKAVWWQVFLAYPASTKVTAVCFGHQSLRGISASNIWILHVTAEFFAEKKFHFGS
jgi:hypothetical protein